jgi:hypothetical protein
MNNEKLQRWALISEIVGGAAVLLTLILLLLEVRQNTQAIRTATYDDLVADLADFNMNIATDDELGQMRFLNSTEGRDPLTDYQLFLLIQINLVRFQHYERAYIQWRAGNLEDSLWERFRDRICSISGDTDFEAQVGPPLDTSTSSEFRDFRLNQCDE